MKLIGFERNDFTVRETGAKITGYNVFLSRPVDASRGKGIVVERQYVSDNKLETAHIDLQSLINKDVRVLYNRWGKLETLTLE